MQLLCPISTSCKQPRVDLDLYQSTQTHTHTHTKGLARTHMDRSHQATIRQRPCQCVKGHVKHTGGRATSIAIEQMRKQHDSESRHMHIKQVAPERCRSVFIYTANRSTTAARGSVHRKGPRAEDSRQTAGQQKITIAGTMLYPNAETRAALLVRSVAQRQGGCFRLFLRQYQSVGSDSRRISN